MGCSSHYSNQSPPKLEQVKIYFQQKGISENAVEQFFNFYNARKLISSKGNACKSWKIAAYQWIANIIKRQPHLFNRHIH